MFTRSVSPEEAPDAPTYLEVDFENGDPVALDGEKLSPASLLAKLNTVRRRPNSHGGLPRLSALYGIFKPKPHAPNL